MSHSSPARYVSDCCCTLNNGGYNEAKFESEVWIRFLTYPERERFAYLGSARPENQIFPLTKDYFKDNQTAFFGPIYSGHSISASSHANLKATLIWETN